MKFNLIERHMTMFDMHCLYPSLWFLHCWMNEYFHSLLSCFPDGCWLLDGTSHHFQKLIRGRSWPSRAPGIFEVLIGHSLGNYYHMIYACIYLIFLEAPWYKTGERINIKTFLRRFGISFEAIMASVQLGIGHTVSWPVLSSRFAFECASFFLPWMLFFQQERNMVMCRFVRLLSYCSNSRQGMWGHLQHFVRSNICFPLSTCMIQNIGLWLIVANFWRDSLPATNMGALIGNKNIKTHSWCNYDALGNPCIGVRALSSVLLATTSHTRRNGRWKNNNGPTVDDRPAILHSIELECWNIWQQLSRLGFVTKVVPWIIRQYYWTNTHSGPWLEIKT